MSTTQIRKFLDEGPEENESREGDARLGQVAVSCGYLTDAQLDECLHEQASSAEPVALGEILMRRKYVTSEQLLRLLVKPKPMPPAPDPTPQPKEATPASDVIKPPTEPGHRWWDAVRIKLPGRKPKS